MKDASERRESANGVLRRDENVELGIGALCEVHCGMRWSQIGILSFQAGLALTGSGGPPRRMA